MARNSGSEGSAHGAELVGGYISLSVKYSSAMQQIGKDLTAFDLAAKESGKRAGKELETGLSTGAAAGARKGRLAALREWSETEVEAKTRSERIGNIIGKAVAAPLVLPIKAARTGIHGLGAAAEKTSKEVEKLGEKGADSIRDIVPMGGALTGALGGVASKLGPIGIAIAAATAAFGGLVAVGEQWEDISHKMAFNTGLKGEDLEHLTNMVAQIGEEIPASFGTIADSVAEVTKNIGLSGDALKTVSEQVTVLRAHGQDVDVEALGKTKRAMGTKDDEVPALLDQLFAANQKTGVSVNALLGGLAAGGAVFKQFGLNVGESAALMTQFDEAGLDVSKVAPDMTRAFKDAAKAGEKFPDFLKDNIEQLKKFKAAGDDVNGNQLAVKLFGPKQAAQIMGLIDSGKLDLDDLSKSAALDGAGPGILPTAKANEGLGDKSKTLMNSFENAFKPAGEGVAKTLGHWMDNIENYRKSGGREKVRAAGEHAFHNVGHAFENIWHAVTNVWHAFENIWHAITNVWHAFENVWHAVTNVWHALENMGHAIGATVAFIIDLPGKIGDVFFTVADKVGGFFSTAADKVPAFFGSAADKVTDFFSSAVDKIVGFFSDLPDKIGKIISDAFSGVGSTITNMFSGIHIPGFAGGGAMSAPGPNGRDSALFWGANNEHVLTSDDVNAAGGHAGVYAWRASLHRDGGGPIGGPDVQAAMAMVGTKYSQGNRTDCSGMVARVIESTLGIGGSLPTTKNMGPWLKALGFKSGRGGPGSIRVGWYNHGAGSNDGHAAMTLSDGENAESGGSHGNFIVGAGAAGADNAEFDQHAYLPASAMFGEGAGGSGGGAFGGAGGGGFGGGASGGGPNSPQARAADDKYAKATEKLTVAREHEAEIMANPKSKQSDKDKAQAETLDAQREATEAQEQLAAAMQQPGGKGGKGDKGNPLGELGGIFDKGITEALLPPGFTKMMDTPLAKSGGALLGFLGSFITGHGGEAAGKGLGGLAGLLTGHGGEQLGGLLGAGSGRADPSSPSFLSGDFTGAAGMWHPQPATGNGDPGGPTGADSQLLMNAQPLDRLIRAVSPVATNGKVNLPGPQDQGQPAFANGPGGQGGGDVHNHYGPNYSGATIGHDPAEHQQAVSNDQQAQKRSNVASTQRQGFVV